MRQRTQLAAFIQAKRHSRQARHSTLRVGTSGQQPHFTPQRHGLSQALCNEANRLLRKAEQERPLHGALQQVHFRHACRCAGILSAVKRGLVGRSAFGRRLHGHRGGRVMQMHNLHLLRTIAPIGHLAARLAHERRQAAAHYDATGEVLAIGTEPAQTREEERVRHLITLWEAHEWQQQTDRLAW